MTFYLITSLIVSIIIKKITAITSEANVNLLSVPYDSPKPVPVTAEDLDEVKFDHEVDNSTESITSQDRISSYYTRRGPSYPFRFGHYHHPHHHHIHPYHHHHHHRSPYYRPRKKHRHGRRPRPYMKSPGKRHKPILLSEVLRNGGHFPFSKIPSGPIIKDYIEEDDLETSPFSSIDTIETYPSFPKLTRPQSLEITDESPDVLPVQPIEEEIIFPGVSNIKPFTSMAKRPQNSIWSLSKPSDSYFDNDSQDNIRNVRFVNNKPTYLDKDVMNLLQKIKLEGMSSDSKPSSSETVQSQRDNITDVNAAISKLLFPFLSDTAIKQIQLYLKSLPSDKQHQGDEANSIENQLREYTRNATQNSYPPSKQYSVTESIKEDESDNSTYFIMVKSPNYKGLNLTKILTQQYDHQRSSNQTDHNGKTEVKSTTPPSKESIALQKYIMMLAGITKDLGNGDNYLPRFSAFQKEKRNL